MITVSIDGRLVAPEAATISVFDRGLWFGDGLFEVFRTWNGVAVTLAEHLDRLYDSAATLQLRVIARDELVAAIDTTLAAARAAGATDQRVRVIVTRGQGAVSARLASVGPGRTIVIAEPLAELPREVSLAVVDWPLPRRPGRAHKALAYLDHVLARELAAAAGADEAARLGPDGDVVECATANLFVVSGPTVWTPPVDAGILPGITRGHVLALELGSDIRIIERRITRAELAAADEVFVTSAVRGVVPVTRLDGEARAAGAITVRIGEAYADRIRQQSVAKAGHVTA